MTKDEFQKQPPEMFCEKDILRSLAKFTGKQLCQGLFFNKVAGQACNFIKKENPAEMLSCEFCEISKNTFSYRTPTVAASGIACNASSSIISELYLLCCFVLYRLRNPI